MKKELRKELRELQRELKAKNQNFKILKTLTYFGEGFFVGINL